MIFVLVYESLYTDVGTSPLLQNAKIRKKQEKKQFLTQVSFFSRDFSKTHEKSSNFRDRVTDL